VSIHCLLSATIDQLQWMVDLQDVHDAADDRLLLQLTGSRVRRRLGGSTGAAMARPRSRRSRPSMSGSTRWPRGES
jgi:hypothetical protein